MKFLSWVGNKLKLVSNVDFIDFGNSGFRLRVAAPTLTADKTGTVAIREETQPLNADLTAIAGVPSTSTGLYRKTGAGTAAVVTIGATGLDSLAAADQAAGRAAIGLSRVQPTSSGVAIRVGTANHASPFALSVQRNDANTYLEILNSYGPGGGVFFGINGTGGVGDAFELVNWQAGPTVICTGPTPTSTPMWTVFRTDGHLTTTGGIAPRYYTNGTLPSAGTVPYGLTAILYTPNETPDTHLIYTNQGNWYKLTGVQI